MFARLLAIGALAVFALAACGGHSAPVMPVAPRGQSTATATFTLRVPLVTNSATAKPAYISPNSQSVRIALTTVNGSAPAPAIPDVVVPLTSSNPACSTTGGTLSCTFSYTAVVGNDVFSITTYASTDGTGNALSTGSASASIQLGVANLVTLALGGVPASLSVDTTRLSAGGDGTKHTLTVNVTAKDASGATIVSPGSYSSAIAVAAINDAQSAISIAPSSIASPSAGGNTAVSVRVDTSKSVGSTTAVTMTAGSASVTIPVAIMTFSPSSLRTFFAGGNSTTLSVSETGYSGAFSLTGGGSVVTASCNPASCAPSSAGGTVSITVSPSTTGSGTFSLTDTASASAAIPYSVAAAPTSTLVSSTGYGHSLYGFGITSSPGGTLFVGGSAPYVNAVTISPCCSGVAFNAGASGTELTIGSNGNLYSASSTAFYVTPLSTCPPTCSASLVANYGGWHTALGSDGNFWLTTFSSTIKRITPSGTETTIAFPNNSNFIASAPDGTLWVSDNNTSFVTHFDPRLCTTTCTTKTYVAPSAQNGIAVDSSGTVWTAVRGQSTLSIIKCPSSCTLTNYTIAPTASNISWLQALPNGLIYGYDLAAGKHYFFGPSSCNSTTKVCTAITTSSESAGSVYEAAEGSDGNLWFVAGTSLKYIALP